MQKLLIYASSSAQQVADSIRLELDLEVHLSSDLRSALAALRQQTFALLLLDEAMLGRDTESANLLYAHAASAPVLELNFAVSGLPRVLRQVRSALARQAHDAAIARASATALLQNELNASLTGLLLESQLALRDAAPAQQPKLRRLVELAADLRDRLRPSIGT